MTTATASTEILARRWEAATLRHGTLTPESFAFIEAVKKLAARLLGGVREDEVIDLNAFACALLGESVRRGLIEFAAYRETGLS